MGYDDTIRYLYGLQKYGIKFGLDNIRRLLSLFGNPQDYFSSIHIAGTNGKGSTSAMTASILNAANFRVGLFTSPHLVSFTERIRVDNEQITEPEVVSLAEEIRFKIQSRNLFGTRFKMTPTFFELVTAMGFLYFKRKGVGWAVVETGMGGRLDATNVLIPEVSVLTTISYDHKVFLGDTISAIAGEKAGIIKERIPVVCAPQEKKVENIIREKAKERSAPLYIYGKDFGGTLRSSSIEGTAFDYSDSDYTLSDVFVPLAGKYQLFNACLAVKAAIIAMKEIRNQKSEIRNNEFHNFNLCNLNFEFIRKGLADTRWPGRLEFISDNPPILIDGAHNPSAAIALADSLREFFLKRYRQIVLIMGIMSDKDIRGIMSPLLPIASEIIFTAPDYERAASPQKLAGCALSLGFDRKKVHTASTVKEAIEMAIKNSFKFQVSSFKLKNNNSANLSLVTPYSALILITGSFYTIGEAKEVLGEKGILSRLRE